MAVTAEVKDRVGWITMDRPPDNAYDAAFPEELDRCVGEVAEAEVAVVVIRAASEKFFSAGADVKSYLEQPPADNIAQHRRAQQVLGRFAAGAPLAVAAITRVVNDGLERTLADAIDRDLEELAGLFTTVDAREGVTAQVEKRAPRFIGG